MKRNTVRKLTHRSYFGYKDRNSYLKSKYGIGVLTYKKMLERQGGKCAICLKSQSTFKKRLAVDHSHRTGEVRGLLCEQCNKALGKFYDSAEVLLRAYKYLKQTQ